MGITHKKVILRRTDGSSEPGYLPSSHLLDQVEDSLDLLGTDGRMVKIPLVGVRYVAYVREFNLSDQQDPEQLSRRTFLARPRAEGLWVRVTLTNGEVLEGLAPLDLTLLEDAVRDKGVFLFPPDPRSNTQRLYIPYSAMSGLQVLSVVTRPSKTMQRPTTRRDRGLDLPFAGPGSKV